MRGEPKAPRQDAHRRLRRLGGVVAAGLVAVAVSIGLANFTVGRGAGEGSGAGGASSLKLTPISLADAVSLPKAPMASPPQVPPPITRRQPATVLVELETIEKKMTLADGVEYTFWTYNGT
ncbi:MAG TPA: hypothetical protein VIL11_05035, partial [Limnochordales bacterium]